MDRRNASRRKSPGADCPVQIDHGCTNNSFFDKEKLYYLRNGFLSALIGSIVVSLLNSLIFWVF